MLSQQEAKNLIDKAISYSKLPGCQVDLYWSEDAFIRYANNGITTSGYRVTQNVSISSVTDDKRHGNAVVNELTDEALETRRGAGRSAGAHIQGGSRGYARAGSAEISGAE